MDIVKPESKVQGLGMTLFSQDSIDSGSGSIDSGSSSVDSGSSSVDSGSYSLDAGSHPPHNS